MERNRWETAIRCLEVALHPATGDDEVIAGVNGFRRTAAGTPLSEICAELAAGAPDETAVNQNQALRHRLEQEHAAQLAALARLREAERLVRALSEEIQAEQQNFAAFRAASADIVDALRHENGDLRGALDRASRSMARPASAFRDMLAAALGEGPQPLMATAAPPGHPWTA
jgi:hypothetical protein